MLYCLPHVVIHVETSCTITCVIMFRKWRLFHWGGLLDFLWFLPHSPPKNDCTMLHFVLFECQWLTQMRPEATELEQGNGSPSPHSSISWVIQKELCSTPWTDKQTETMFSSEQDLDTQTHTKNTPKPHYFVAFTHGWLIIIRAEAIFGFIGRVKHCHSVGECSSILSEG